MLKRILRRIAWRIIAWTNGPGPAHVIFTHRACGSKDVVPLGKFFPSWQEAAFECLGCGCITSDVDCCLAEPEDIPEECCSYPLYVLA